MNKKILIVQVDDETSEEFRGESLHVDVKDTNDGSTLIIKDGFDVVAMFYIWRYWRYENEPKD